MRPYGDECDPWLKHRDSGKCIKNAGLHKTGLLRAVISELEQYRVGKIRLQRSECASAHS